MRTRGAIFSDTKAAKETAHSSWHRSIKIPHHRSPNLALQQCAYHLALSFFFFLLLNYLSISFSWGLITDLTHAEREKESCRVVFEIWTKPNEGNGFFAFKKLKTLFGFCVLDSLSITRILASVVLTRSQIG